jgi:hypothetical protein
MIRARTAEGRERAAARGLKMERPSKLTPHQKKEARRYRKFHNHRFREFWAFPRLARSD